MVVHSRSFLAFFLIFSLFFLHCKYSIRLEMEGANYCRAAKIGIQSAVPRPMPIEYYLGKPTLRLRFSNRTLRIAYAYGFVDELEKLVEWERANPANPDLSSPLYRRTEHKVNRLIQYAILDIEATTSELRCYNDRFTEILAEMKATEDDVVQDNSLYAIVSGAVFALMDGATYFDPSPNRAIIVTGGILVTYYSWKAFSPSVVTEFRPKSTILKEIWSNPKESNNFSAPLWYLITNPMEADKPSIRDMLVDRWVKNGFLGEEGKNRDERISVYFEKGGVANIEMMGNRKEMITGLKSSVSLLLQDIRNLQSELLYFENLDEKGQKE